MFKNNRQSDVGRKRTAPRASSPMHGVFSYHSARNDQRDVSRSQRPTPNIDLSSRLNAPGIVQRLKLFVPLAVAITVFMLSVGLDPHPSVVIKGSSETQDLYGSRQAEYIATATKSAGNDITSYTKLTVNTSKLRADMLRAHAELEEVNVSLPLFGLKPVVTVSPAPAVLLLRNNSGTIIVDNKGYARANATEDMVQSLPLVDEQNNLSIQVGDLALQQSHVAFILELIRQSEAKAIQFESLTLPKEPFTLYAKPKGKSYYAKFNLQSTGTMKQQVGGFIAMQEYTTERGITPREYIDVRVEGRAYYK